MHCGSRNFGLKVFSYWNKIAKSMCVTKAELRAITEEVKSRVNDKKALQVEIKKAKGEYLKTRIPNYLGGDSLKGYLVDVLFAQTYARLNHDVIHSIIDGIYAKLSDGGKRCDEIVTTHNYIDYDLLSNDECHVMARKGAVRSYVGERLIIPFNMRDGVAICEGKSNEDWNFTAPHGAGRLMSRSKAKSLLSLEEFKKEMRDANICTTTADSSTLDEAPSAYKSKDEIVGLIEPTVNILYFMYPRVNLKASE